MDIAAARARYEAAMAAHRELEAIPKSVCLGCGALESWPCDAVGLAADSAIALEALEEAQGSCERQQHLSRIANLAEQLAEALGKLDAVEQETQALFTDLDGDFDSPDEVVDVVCAHLGALDRILSKEGE